MEWVIIHNKTLVFAIILWSLHVPGFEKTNLLLFEIADIEPRQHLGAGFFLLLLNIDICQVTNIQEQLVWLGQQCKYCSVQ